MEVRIDIVVHDRRGARKPPSGLYIKQRLALKAFRRI